MTKSQQKALELIGEKLAQRADLLEECERIAVENQVDFEVSTATGSYESFDGAGTEYSDDGMPTGWNHSQC